MPRISDRLSIRQWLVSAIVVLLGLFGLACVTSLVTFDNLDRVRASSEQMNTVLAQTTELNGALMREESALRAYVLSGAPRYRKALDSTRDQIESALALLVQARQGWLDSQNRLERIQQLQRQWREGVVAPILKEVESGDLDTARARVIGGASVKLFDPMHAALTSFRADAQERFARSVARLDTRQERARWVLGGVLLMGLLLGLLMIRGVMRRVTRPLTRLNQITRRLAAGERDIDIAYREQSDEIGAVARTLERFRRISLDQDSQDWVRDHRARLTMLMHKCTSGSELGERLLGELAPLLGAGYAALFAPKTAAEDEDRHALLAAYGYSDEARTAFAPGEGLVGQVLRSGERIELADLPERYLSVRSGLGQAHPEILILAPGKVRDEVIAVIELALFKPLTERELELLDSLLPNIALALLMHARAQRTKELLEESRAHVEALDESRGQLRERQEALSQANSELRMQSEELNAQAEQLRASEEELKVQAEELQNSNEELRQKQEVMSEQQTQVLQLHAEAEQRADELARANRYKSEFLANMSHELRTPLNSLLILSRSLAENEADNLDADQLEAAGIIHESGTNLLGLINDILDLSKIEAGKMQVVPQATAVASFATRIERHFAHMAADKGLEFTVEIANGVPEQIVTDAGKLEQIVRNLVGNALKFTERGAVRVEVARPAIDTFFQREDLDAGRLLAIHVVDEGIGIPRDRLEKIFEAFEQVDAGTSRSYGGTGLGLSISRELAGLLGGELAVVSQPGEGSRFSVYIEHSLPCDTPSAPQSSGRDFSTAPAAMAVESAPKPTGERPQLLVIDDDPVFTGAVADAARRHGFECSVAASGEAGLASVRQRNPDAIVLDLGLPGMDGWAVLDALKADERTRGIPVHIVSARDDPGHTQQAGAVGFLQKPISLEDLDVLFARAETLSGRAARRVLVVDDDRDAHTAISHLLKHKAVEIVSVANGAAAIEALGEQHFDCVVLDLRLPDISGFDLLEQIAARDDAPPVVVYSARELSEEQTRALRIYTDSIVIKGSRAQERLLDEISIFFHRLTESREAPAPAKVPTVRTDSELAGHTVLLVDDDMRNTFALSRVLRARGLKVLMASDGFKALDQLDANDSISVVLMDIMMPGMDGFEVIRRIRAQRQYADLPIIALTAKAMPGDREQCLQAGAHDYLPKPLDTTVLTERIRALV